MFWTKITKSEYKRLADRVGVLEELVERHYHEHRKLRGYVYGSKRNDEDDEPQAELRFTGSKRSYDKLSKDELRTQLQREGRLRAGRE